MMYVMLHMAVGFNGWIGAANISCMVFALSEFFHPENYVSWATQANLWKIGYLHDV